MRRYAFFVPFVVLTVLAVYFAIGLQRDPGVLPSVLIDQKVPEFDLPAIEGRAKGFASADLLGQVSLVNIFGSWCVSCRIEHPFLMELKKQNIIPVHGIDWREPDRQTGPRWLKKFGNPYTLIGDDPKSRGAIAFGVTGAPETFIVDKTGVIRFKFAGPMSPQIWNEKLFPIVQRLREQ